MRTRARVAALAALAVQIVAVMPLVVATSGGGHEPVAAAFGIRLSAFGLASRDRADRHSGGRSGERVPSQPARSFADPFPPARSVPVPHQDVVGVAALRADAGQRRRGLDRVEGAPLPLHDPVASGDHSQRQIGVFPVGATEAFVEATDPQQCGTPVSHVRGDPPGGGQTSGAALGVGGSPVQREGHLDATLGGAHIRAKPVQVVDQLRGPVRPRQHVVVEERHPLGIRGAPPNVARRCRTALGASWYSR